jgi:hypothetical protein
MYIRRMYMGPHTVLAYLVKSVLEGSRLAAGGELWKAQIALRGALAGLTFKPRRRDTDPLPPHTVWRASGVTPSHTVRGAAASDRQPHQSSKLSV